MRDFALVCASHTPLLMRAELASPATLAEVRVGFQRLADFVRAFDPARIIQFSPDHFHGFDYGLMPSFCVGAAATACGDWGSSSGPLSVDEGYALQLLDAVREADIDAAVSFDMTVDHGFVQIWDAMFGSFEGLPITPVFVNAAGRPLPKYRRARLLGQACGRFAAARGERVLFVASGGLSHDPLVPTMAGATPAVRDRLLGRSPPTAYDQSSRERAVHQAGLAAINGEGPARPLAPLWDAAFLDRLGSRDWTALDAMNPDEVDRDAGSGANEVLAWVAAAAAMDAAASGFEIVQRDYQPIPGWIAGFALLAARG